MSRKDEPAYPCAENHMVAADFAWTGGLTIREYFVAAAPAQEIVELIPETIGERAALLGISVDQYTADWHDNYPRLLAKLRCKWADATLAAMEGK